MRIRIIAVAAIFLAVSISASGDEHKHKKSTVKYGPEFRVFKRGMDSGMKKMMNNMHSAGYTGNPDVDFLSMMIPHHEGAIEMARLELIYGNDPLVRKLAEDIIAGQRSEVESMRLRLRILKGQVGISPEEFPALGGTRGK